MKTPLLTYCCLLVLAILSTRGWSQDSHFAQYNLAPIFFNPALAGIMGDESHRFAIKYRNQWSSVLNSGSSSFLNEQAFQTYLLSYDGRWIIGQDFLSFGSQLYTQKVDFPSYQTFAGKLTGGYHLEIDEGLHLGLGLELGWRNYSLGLNELTFDAQFDQNSGFDPFASNGEPFDDGSGASVGFVEVGSGISLYRRGTLIEWIISGSINSTLVGKDFSFFPNSFNSSQDRGELKRRLSFQGNLLWHNRYDPAGRKRSFNLRFLFVSQGVHWFAIPSIEYKRYFRRVGSRHRTRKSEVALGLGTRISSNAPKNSFVNDALLLFLTTDVSTTMTIGLSYDINTSSLRKASNLRGGPELSFLYKLRSKQPLPCPTL